MNRSKGIILCILALVCTVFYSTSVYATEKTNTASKRLIKSLSWTEYDKYLTIEKGEKEQLSVTYSPSKKINKKLKWSSSKKKIVSVNKKGVITGKKNGTAVITAKAKDGSKKKIKLKVTVGKRAEELTFTNSEKYSKMYVGNTYTLKAAFTPSNTSNKKLTWSSSDEDIATVNSNGKVTAKANGKVMIMAETTDGSGVYFGEIFEVATLAKSISLSLDGLEKIKKKIIQCYKATHVECQAIFINAIDLRSEAD